MEDFWVHTNHMRKKGGILVKDFFENAVENKTFFDFFCEDFLRLLFWAVLNFNFICSTFFDTVGHITLGAVHKERSYFRCRCPHFLVQKTLEFSKFMVCGHGQEGRGLSHCGHFADKGEGSIFRDFVRTLFMDDPKAEIKIFIWRMKV